MASLLRAQKGKSDLTVDNDYHKQNDFLIDSFPKIVPLYDGRELQINQNLVMNGLATISIRNMKSDKFSIQKRNSFFNLHRPELKGINILPTENQQGKILQQRILKEVEIIRRIKSTELFSKNDGSKISSENKKQSSNIEDNMKSECGLLMGTRFQKKCVIKTFDQSKDSVDRPETKPTEPTSVADKLCVHEVETKSTLIN